MKRVILLLLSMLGWNFAAVAATTADSEAWTRLLSQLQQPSMGYRLKARTAPSTAALEALAAAGFGGVEIGVDFRAPPPQAKQELRELLEAGRAAHLQVDLAPGGGQPYVSPGIADADSMQQLVADARELEPNRSFEVAIRQPATLVGQAMLVAVTAACIDHRADDQWVLDPDSAIDLTPKLTNVHELHWSGRPGQWVLFSFWQRATGQIPGPNPFQSPAEWSAHVPAQSQGRYYTADIFGAGGMTSALDFLSANILPADAALLSGGGLAHDSLEVQAEIFWTKDLPSEFQRRRGYSLLPFLPAIVAPKKYSFNPLDPRWGGPLPGKPYDFAGGIGERIRYDFDETLTDLYIDRYLAAKNTWAHAHGLQTRDQVAYNYFSLDMLRGGRAVDIPENESLDSGWRLPFDSTMPAYGTDRWRHMMDSYRLTGSSKDLAGHHRATLEFGDDFAIYHKQPIDYAQQLNESLAGGITMGLMTAFTSTDPAWPKPRGLAMVGLGDDWSSGWPQWRDWAALAGYFARSTVVTEFGQAAVDVAVYHDRGLSTVHDDAPLYASSRLETAGYTYDFIDPAALIIGGVPGTRSLFESTGYRALVIDNQAAIPVDVAHTLLALARRHVPIIIVGPAPSRSPGWLHHEAQDRGVGAAMRTLLSMDSVAAVGSRDEVPAALARKSCLPDASFAGEPPLLSVHRRAPGIDVWWLYNASERPVVSVGSFRTRGVPFMADLWTGQATPTPSWQQSSERTLVPIALAPRHSMALIFRHTSAAGIHIVSAGDARLLATQDAIALYGSSGVQHLSLSDGSARTIDAAVLPASVVPVNWHLQVDEFSPEGHRAHDLRLSSLQDWRAIPELQEAVGQAIYSAELTLPEAWVGIDRTAVLSIGEVAGAMRVSINDQLVTEQSVGDGEWIVGPLLKRGPNTIQIRLDTTLTNRMAALRASGAREYQTGPTPLESAPSGVLGPVVLSSALLLKALDQ